MLRRSSFNNLQTGTGEELKGSACRSKGTRIWVCLAWGLSAVGVRLDVSLCYSQISVLALPFLTKTSLSFPGLTVGR